MQLSTVKISNLLSFPFVENLTEMEGVKFHNDEKWVINIIIGPNGSGKSNLLDIIHALWKYGITINYEITPYPPVQEGKPTIQENNTTEHNLTKHRATPNQPSHIYLSLLLSQHDTDNLCFVNKYTDILNNIIEKYSHLTFRFKKIDSQLLIDQKKFLSTLLSIPITMKSSFVDTTLVLS